MWQQITDPLHNVLLSAGVAVIPIIFLFILLLSRKVAGHVATLLTLLAGLIIAVSVHAAKFGRDGRTLRSFERLVPDRLDSALRGFSL